MTTTPIQTNRDSVSKNAPVTAPTAERKATYTIPESSQSRFLIIGYGYELRGDDAVGPKVATAVAEWRLSAVKTLAVHQLTPDLASDVSRADYVIFVNACGGEHCARTVQLEPIVGERVPNSLPRNTSHSGDPWILLNLASQVYGHSPQAWLLQIPTESFNFGDALSSTAQSGCDLAVRTIEHFLQTYQ